MSDVSPQPPAGSAPPLDDEGKLDVTLVLEAYRSLQQQGDRVQKLVADFFGMGTTDLRCLTFIANDHDTTPKRAAEFLELSTGATTSLVDRLEGGGYISRQPHPSDRRSVLLELAPAGREAIDQIDEFYRRAFRDAVDPNHLDFLAVAMRAIGDSLTRTAAEGEAVAGDAGAGDSAAGDAVAGDSVAGETAEA
jgi:DNA-binding MarR family transcriptional regulator